MTTAPPNDRSLADQDEHDHDRGLAFDLSTLLNRRRMLQLIGGAGVLALAGCASSGSSGSSGGSATTASATTAAGAGTTGSSGGSVGVIAEETAGPFPADGSNGVNVLTESGIVRQDIRSSFGSSSGTADGVPSTVSYTVVDASTGQPVSGAAVYMWHCDRDGQYSLYSQGATDQNYLRGVQETNADGVATFTTIYPACYSGRWPHIHFEVYPSLDEATAAGTPVATSQIALPEDVSTLVYATDGYEQSVQNLSQVSLSSDMVFSDGVETETPTVTGSVDAGYAIALTVGVTA
ncbi:MAG TPA: intradiol ring-cleavage dioxygenase [Acidimicrobiales bacterium]